MVFTLALGIMESTTEDGILNESCEDMFLTQNSFNPPADYGTQQVVDNIDEMLTFHENGEIEEDWREHKSVQFFDFTYQVDNGSSIPMTQGSDATSSNVDGGKCSNEQGIVPLISDLHLDEFFAEVT